MGQACCPGANGAAATCDTGLACGGGGIAGGGTCGACGGMGQACCPDPTGALNGLCGAGFQCSRAGGGGGGALRCNACGGKGQACCGTGAVATRTCTTGMCANTGLCP